MSALPQSAAAEPRVLRLFEPGGQTAEPTAPSAVGTSAAADQPTAEEVRALIGRLTQLLPAEPDTRPDAPRPTEPVLTPPSLCSPAVPPAETAWSLRQCLQSDYTRNELSRQPVTWSLYRTLVKHWEAAWGGPGPDCRSLTGEQLQAAFAKVSEWSSLRSWEKNRSCLFALLQSCCAQSRRNLHGIPRPAIPPLVLDDLPIWKIPPREWFRSRPKPATRHPGHCRSSLPLLEVAEFDRVLAACAGTSDPLYFRVLLGWFWFCGMRCRDAILSLPWRETQTEDGVDLGNRLLHFEESKCGGALDVPLPSWLCEGLCALKTRQPKQLELFPGSQRFVFVRRPNWKQLSRWFYSDHKSGRLGAWDSTWASAGVACRKPHQMRGVSISWWLAKAEKYRKLVTGHSLGNDVQMRVYATFGEDFRAAAEAFPRPTLPLV